jgi:hypothetical protein
MVEEAPCDRRSNGGAARGARCRRDWRTRRARRWSQAQLQRRDDELDNAIYRSGYHYNRPGNRLHPGTRSLHDSFDLRRPGMLGIGTRHSQYGREERRYVAGRGRRAGQLFHPWRIDRGQGYWATIGHVVPACRQERLLVRPISHRSYRSGLRDVN